MTKTEALTLGVKLDGWTRTYTKQGIPCWEKQLKVKGSVDTVPAWLFIGGNASLRMAVGKCAKGEARAVPNKAARMIALGMSQASPEAILAELEKM